MARITVEDYIKKIDSQYDLVLLAKERTAQLNSGAKSLVDPENDKNTVISLREIGDSKITIKSLEDAAINKLRKVQSEPNELEDLEIEQDDDFDKIYKGEISKSGAAILPSKRVRKIPEKINLALTEETKEETKEEIVEEIEEEIKEDINIKENDQENQIEPDTTDSNKE